MNPSLPKNPNHILLVRLSAIGDIVMASGLPSLVRQRWPEAKISWLCQPECHSLLANHPDLDQVISWPRSDWQSAWKAKDFSSLNRYARKFRNDCRSQGFDLAIDLQGLLKSALLTRLSGAPFRIGLGRAEGAGFLYNRQFGRDGGNTRLIGSEYRFLADQLGADSSAYRMQIHANPAAEAADKALVEHAGGEGNYLIFCPFTTRPQKHWFDAHWQQLAELLDHQLRIPIVVLGGPADAGAAEKLCGGTPMQNRAGQTSLLQACELIRHSRGVIGVDTGLTHMGHAARVPTLALFGSTCPYLNPDNPAGKVLYLNLDCAPCRRNPTCNGRFDCLGGITATMAYDHFLPLLDRLP